MFGNIGRWATWTVFFTCVALKPAIVQASTYAYHPSTVLYLGSTFEPTDLSRSYPPCIDYDVEFSLDRAKIDYSNGAPPTGEFGSETNFNVSQVQSQKDLYRYLHLSASISGHYKFFSAGGTFDLEEESRFHEDNFSWIVRAVTDYGRFGMMNPRLNQSALALTKNLAAFRQRCGYEYVSQVNRSVIAAAVYTIRNVNSSDKRKLEATFNAAIGGGGVGH